MSVNFGYRGWIYEATPEIGVSIRHIVRPSKPNLFGEILCAGESSPKSIEEADEIYTMVSKKWPSEFSKWPSEFSEAVVID